MFFMMKLMIAAASVMVSGVVLTPARADDLDQNLVARWTFKDGSLDSDVGGFSFVEGGKTGTVDPENGSVTVRGRKYLVASDISVAKFPDLAKSVTLWARLKFEQLPPENVANIFGLQTVPGNGSWPSISFALIYRGPEPELANPGLTVLARLKAGTEIGVGPRRFVPVAAGEYFNAAVVYDSSTGTVNLWVNGSLVSSKGASGLALQDFEALGIGQLSSPGVDVAVTYDEVRVYSVALDQQWLEEITPAKE